VDLHVGKALLEEWYSSCEYPIQLLLLVILFLGLPGTFLVEATKETQSFR
jgi:hypothetical protein